MSIQTVFNRVIAATRRFAECIERVEQAGSRPWSHVRRFPDGARLWAAEASLNKATERRIRAEKRAMEAIRRLAAERGIVGTDPVAVETSSGLWIVTTDVNENLFLVSVPTDRIVRGGVAC